MYAIFSNFLHVPSSAFALSAFWSTSLSRPGEYAALNLSAPGSGDRKYVALARQCFVFPCFGLLAPCWQPFFFIAFFYLSINVAAGRRFWGQFNVPLKI